MRFAEGPKVGPKGSEILGMKSERNLATLIGMHVAGGPKAGPKGSEVLGIRLVRDLDVGPKVCPKRSETCAVRCHGRSKEF